MSDSATITRLNSALEGRYRIEREIGEGGMATVYLADDLRHERKVAVKVLKPELAAVVGGERFLAEIRTTANLQHPNILPLFDSGEADSFLFYVMPYVEGESLREKLDREKQLHVDEAVGIATEVAEALHTAHGQGIIHRDIKPANILLSSGRPLVADFGIALAVTQAGGERITETGLSLGTPYYMSPEQATGDRVPTAASDVYGLACVLYEMLTGEPPHTGSTAQAVLGKILLGSPTRATELRPAIPAHIDSALLMALEKLPADRFDSAAEFARALSSPSFRYGAAAAAGGAGGGTGRTWKVAAVAAGATALLLAGGLGWTVTQPGEPPPVSRQVLAPFAQGTGYNRPVGALTALAPDGSSMVHARVTQGTDWELVVKQRGSAVATPLPGTANARVPTYSPDGREIAWVSGQELKKRPLEGGAVLTLARDVDGGMPALSWMDDGTLLYERDEDNALVRIPATGGEPEDVRVFGDTLLAWSDPLPGSRAALLEICPSGNCPTSQLLVAIDLESGELTELMNEVLRAWWLASGHVVFVRRDGTVAAAPFDPSALAFTGPAVPLFENVATGLSYPEMALGDDGTLVYIEGSASGAAGGRQLVWVNREGVARPLDPAMDPGLYQEAVLSPDGTRAAIIVGPEGPGSQLWVKELPAGPLTRLTDAPGSTLAPAWTPDGTRIAYIASDTTDGRTGALALTIAADGSSLEPEILLDHERDVLSVSYTPDGTGIVARLGQVTGGGEADLGYMEPGRNGEVEMLLESPYNEFAPAVSPDGRWLAYVSDVSGRLEVFVRPFGARGGSRTQVSSGGGVGPVWTPAGDELYYVNPDTGVLWLAGVEADGSFRVTSRAELYSLNNRGWVRDVFGRMFDVGPDGEEILLVFQAGAATGDASSVVEDESRYILVQNWFTELDAQLRAAEGRAR